MTETQTTKDDGTQSMTDWAAENMTHVVVYGNYQNDVPVEYVSELETEESAHKLAKRKRTSEKWDFAYVVRESELHQ